MNADAVKHNNITLTKHGNRQGLGKERGVSGCKMGHAMSTSKCNPLFLGDSHPLAPMAPNLHPSTYGTLRLFHTQLTELAVQAQFNNRHRLEAYCSHLSQD
jgi:hypothetical protein